MTFALCHYTIIDTSSEVKIIKILLDKCDKWYKSSGMDKNASSNLNQQPF